MSDQGDFGLHVRLGRRRNRHIRLTRATTLLLVAAVLGWLLGLSPGLQLALSLLPAFIGLVWPVQGSEDWALGLIRSQRGLAYETALLVGDQPRDEFGLAAQVRSRARSSIAGLAEPRFPEWWLAALVVALFILLLPALQLRSPWSQAEAEPPPDNPPAAAAEQQAEADPEQTTEPEQVEAGQELPPQAVQPPTGAADERGAAATEAPVAEGDGEVLDRFLDNLRERPREIGPDAELAGTPVPADAEDASESAEDEPPAGTAPAAEEPGADPERSADGQPAGAGADGGAEDGNSEADTDESGAAAEPQAGEDGLDPGDPGEDGPQAGQEEGSEGDMGFSPGDEDGQSAGAGAGPETVAGQDQLDGAEGEEQFLEGQLSSSEVNVGGDIRLPGFADVELPPGAAATGYGEAVERALTGGTVPLEYQEIIRNYFR